MNRNFEGCPEAATGGKERRRHVVARTIERMQAWFRRVDPEARGLFAVTERRLVGAETGESKRLERRVIKRLSLRDVASADRYVIEHIISPGAADQPVRAAVLVEVEP